MPSNSDDNKSHARPATPLLRRLSKKYVLAALGALLVFDVVFYLLAVMPLSRREAEQQALLGALERQVEAKNKDLEQLQLIGSKVAAARTEGDALLDDITLIRRTAFSKLFAEMLQAAAQSGIDTREGSFDIEPIEGTDDYGLVSISANFRGEYQKLVKLLNQLDRSDQFLIIESLSAAPRADSSELQITMRLNTFLREL